MLYKVARSGFYDLTKELLECDGVDVNQLQRSSGSTALHAACFYGHLPVVQLLVAKGADVTKKNQHGATVRHPGRGRRNERLRRIGHLRRQSPHLCAR